jgi:hypothetical protein
MTVGYDSFKKAISFVLFRVKQCAVRYVKAVAAECPALRCTFSQCPLPLMDLGLRNLALSCFLETARIGTGTTILIKASLEDPIRCSNRL